MSLSLLMLLIAAILFALAGAGVSGGRINLVALGLLAWVLTILLPVLG